MGEETQTTPQPEKGKNLLWIILAAVGFLIVLVVVLFVAFNSSGGKNLIVGELDSSGEMDIYIVKLGKDLKDGFLFVEEAELGFGGLGVYMDSDYQKSIFSAGFLPDSKYVFAIYEDEEDTIISQIKIGGKEPFELVSTEDSIYGALYADTETILFGERQESGVRCYFSDFDEEPDRIGKGDNCFFTLDGSRIFVEEIDDGEYTLTGIDIKSGDEVKLFETEDVFVSIALTHDGSYIAYVTANEDGEEELFLVDFEEGEEEDLSDSDAVTILEYGFAHEKDYGYFISGDEENFLSLYRFDSSGETDKIAEGYFLTAFMDMDGEYMVYLVGEEEAEIAAYSYSFRSGDSEEIMDGEHLYLARLRDSGKIMIADITEDEEDATIYTVDWDGENLVEIWDDELDLFHGFAYVPGTEVLYFLLEDEDGMTLYVSPIDSDEGFELLEEWYDIDLLNIDPDGKYLVFEGIEDSGDDPYLYSIEIEDGADFVELDDDGERFINAVFTPNSKSILYTADVGDGDDDYTVFIVPFDGEDKPEELYEEARLLDVQWDDLYPFTYPDFYDSQEGDYVVGVNVAIYDHGIYSDISYFSGGVKNNYDIFVDALYGYEGFIEVDVITDLDYDTLSNYDRLILPDNAVPDEYLEDVDRWFTSDKKIIGLDSAICYLAYAGYMWPDLEGDIGKEDYWGYESFGEIVIVSTSSFITDGYEMGDLFDVVTGDAWLFASMLPSDVDVIATASSNPDFVSIVVRDVPGKGSIVFIGQHMLGGYSDLEQLIRNAVQ